MNKIIESFKSNGDIELYMKQSIRDPNLELEVIYGDIKDKKILSKIEFLDLIKKFEEHTYYTNLGETSTLDIRCELRNKHKSVPSSMRLTIEGLDQIQKYCKTDMLESINYSLIDKKRYKDVKNPSTKYDSIHSSEYPCRINLKYEKDIQNDSREAELFTKDWSKKNKGYRYKKRYSFLSLNKIWRIDITGIKQTNISEYFKTFRQSKLLQQPERYELEIEYVGTNKIPTFTPDPIYSYAKMIEEIDNPFYQISDIEQSASIDNDLSLMIDNDTTELSLYESSPRYTDIEFDEPLPEIESPISLPEKITIRDIFWKEGDIPDSETVGKLIKKGYEPEEWVHNDYKLIPRKRLYIDGEYVIKTEVSPSLEYSNKEGKEVIIEYINVPLSYIIEELERSNQITDTEFRGGGGGSEIYSSKVIDGLYNDLEIILNTCFEIIFRSSYYLGKSEELAILKKYFELTDQKKEGIFVGPQPVSMGLEHINQYNSNAIMSNYAVTEKADGERAELIIIDNHGYLVTPKKRVIDTGTKFENISEDWIFDGEYITQNKNKEPIKLFMIFDVYYSTGSISHPYSYPWYTKKGISRSSIIHDFKETVNIVLYKDSVRMGFKQYYNGPEKLIEKDGKYKNLLTIFKYSKKILESEGGFEYFTDGLIFLPMSLSVKGYDEGESVKSIKGTWSLNYKWKPPEENTIDFKIIFAKENNRLSVHSYSYVGEDGKKEIKYYQKVQLVVQYKEKDDKSIDFNWSLLTNRPSNKRNYQYFNPNEYKKDNIHLSNIPLVNNKMICNKDNRVIQNGDIVEMRYNPDNEMGYNWEPLRIRDDKLKPQYFTIANNIWSTINNPITEEMIKGVINFDENEEYTKDQDKYYVNTNYEISEDKPIRSFHNYIKSKLISRVCSSDEIKGKLMIADLSCGRGGDVMKYLSIKNEVGFLLGLDISSNINEAAQRYYYLPKPKPRALFLQYDTSKSIVNKEGCLGDREICETMIDMILNKSKSFTKKYKDIQKEYSGIAKSGFDVISSQFSLHYYFKDEETIRGFCENLRDLCSSGGYFIGTCYDGYKLFETFNSLDSDIIEMKDDFGSLIYQIKKLYTIDDFTYNKDFREDMLGQKIEVFMTSIGQPIVEYLVNFEYFIDIMKEYGFELAIPSFRKGEYNPIKEPLQSFDKLISLMSEIRENDNQFINKTKNSDLFKIDKHKGYSLLSGLNNWFIFQKK